MIHRPPLPRGLVLVLASIVALSTTSLCFAQDSSGSTSPTDNEPEGVSVAAVAAGGPAASAGVSTHDIITAVDGSPVRSWEQLTEALKGLRPGDTMELTLLRAPDRTLKGVAVTLGANPADPSLPWMGLTITLPGYLLLVPASPPAQGRVPSGT